jgi:pyruvate-formate lyase-activating enzyme
MLGASLGRPRRPAPRELIPLPEGSRLYTLPGRRPLAWDPEQGEPVVLTEYGGGEVFAACAFLAPAHTGLLSAAYRTEEKAPVLPLYAYTALGWQEGEGFVASAVRVDPDVRQDARSFDEDRVDRAAGKILRRYPGNRLVEHLVNNCVRTYVCPAARNFVLGRWEAPIPIAPTCNADCIGCISLQPEGAVPASMDRITFTPTVDEIVEYAVPHLVRADRAVVSFGQGCEGEPLLQAGLIEETVRAIRDRTLRGVINLNTNASRPDAVEALAAAGLDSMRVSLNSLLPDRYAAYYRPRGYGLDEVLESIRRMRRAGRWVSINYLTFPGVNDRPEEVEALAGLLEDPGVSMIQWRNLNLDPEPYLHTLGLAGADDTGIGVLNLMRRVRRIAPEVAFGYFNPDRTIIHGQNR